MYRQFSFQNEGVEEAGFRRVCSVLMRKAKELCAVSEGEGLTWTFRNDGALAPGAYRISHGEDRVILEASERLGLISAAGRVLQEGIRREEGFLPGAFAGTFAPKCAFSGIYFASHFGNYYVNAPLEDVLRYVEDLALWGCGMLRVWFDFHTYTGIDDPAAQPVLDRLEKILRTAQSLGMKIGYILLGNEGYRTTPEALKAEWRVGNGYFREPRGHYHTEVCPSTPEGMELIVKTRLEFLDRFREIPPGILAPFVYDQGGCTCPNCAPWAANGYVKVLKALVPEIRKRWPECRIGFCVWYLDRFVNGEWDRVFREFETDEFLKNEIDYITEMNSGALPKDPVYAERIRRGIGPGGKPIIGFPEISMQGCTPWGGFGANPYPDRLQADWDVTGRTQAGMWCYSEGRFEDVNKFIELGLYSGRYSTALEAMRGYVRAEFGDELEEKITRLLRVLEETLPREKEPPECTDAETVRWVVQKPERIEEAAVLAGEIDAFLPERVRKGWRWRIIYLRAMADLELKKADYFLREEMETYLRELETLYYTDGSSILSVSPLTREAFRRDARVRPVY